MYVMLYSNTLAAKTDEENNLQRAMSTTRLHACRAAVCLEAIDAPLKCAINSLPGGLSGGPNSRLGCSV